MMRQQNIENDARIAYHQALAEHGRIDAVSRIADYLQMRCHAASRGHLLELAGRELQFALKNGAGADAFFRRLDSRAEELKRDAPAS